MPNVLLEKPKGFVGNNKFVHRAEQPNFLQHQSHTAQLTTHSPCLCLLSCSELAVVPAALAAVDIFSQLNNIALR